MSDKESTGNQSMLPPGPSLSGEFTAPLNSATNGRLVFASGAAGVTIRADPGLAQLYRAYVEHRIPGVQEQDGVVTIRYRCFPFLDRLVSWREPVAEITLNDSLPWEIEFRGGVSRLTADLSSLQLRALDLNSASQVRIILPQPSGNVFAHIAGSVSGITIQRPAGVALRIDIGGSASNLSLDQDHFEAVANGMFWQTSGYDSAADRYDISVSGSISDMTIGARSA